ncbi:unnamed protein product [Protopolystoma xenopodis]|uniref:Protein kinase domain-containing protein n=1 Tax=Protopolystoma xenopodis TaxID=117903 RepID=A0A448WFP8_9PLAT|nr:unnamed protein product [Protopolystoma xenopodis]
MATAAATSSGMPLAFQARCVNSLVGRVNGLPGGQATPDLVLARDTRVVESYKYTKKVGSYLLGRCLGSGSFAKVHEALHLPTGEKVNPCSLTTCVVVGKPRFSFADNFHSVFCLTYAIYRIRFVCFITVL